MVASNKSVFKEAEKTKEYPSYELSIVFAPTGLQIKQTPKGVGPFDIIAILDVVKGMHTKHFLDTMSGEVAQKSGPVSGVDIEALQKEAE